MTQSYSEDQALRLATHRHYKGGLYRWIANVADTETNESRTWYEHIWPHAISLHDRPAAMFYGLLPDGRRRFEPLAEGPTLMSPEAAQVLAAAVDEVKRCAADINPGIAKLISAASLVSLHHKICMDRVFSLEKQQRHVCTECHGAGKIKRMVRDQDPTGAEVIEFMAWTTCPACLGVGVLKGTGLH